MGNLFERHRIGVNGKQLTPFEVADSNPELQRHEALVGVIGVQSELLPQPPLFTEQGFDCVVLDVNGEVEVVEDVDVTDEVEEVVDPLGKLDEVVDVVIVG